MGLLGFFFAFPLVICIPELFHNSKKKGKIT